MIKDLLPKTVSGQDLSYEEAKSAVEEIMSGDCPPTLISAFLTALAMKKETDSEIAGCADGMRAKSLKLKTDCETLEIVGTGGDKSNSFNISTTSAFVIAASGVKVTKHGNRAASSNSGAADCLEALGIKINVSPEIMKKALDETNMSFLFAQTYHPAMRNVGAVRKEIGIRTVFNILGPLTNPANAKMTVLGVFSREYVEKIAKALVRLGVSDALVVYGLDGLDEVSACGETTAAEIRNGKIDYYNIKPEDFGFDRCKKEELLGGTPAENAKIAKNILSGGGTYAQRLAVILNAGAGIYVAGKGEITLSEAVKKAENILKSKKALDVLNRFTEITNE
ncbi:MAG: anthranilate phosphoribosyltransferase [Clostridiales bacterium]|nr:anthranilate phosphoribosyltransferase [Clostridiales bacterium]